VSISGTKACRRIQTKPYPPTFVMHVWPHAPLILFVKILIDEDGTLTYLSGVEYVIHHGVWQVS